MDEQASGRDQASFQKEPRSTDDQVLDSATPVSFGPFHFDPRRQLVLRDGKRIKLGQKPLTILEAVLRNGDRLVSYQELGEVAWPPDRPGDYHDVQQAVIPLLKVLKYGKHEFIQNIRGKGYCFNPLPDSAKLSLKVVPEPQSVRWGPMDGKPPGIAIDGTTQFIPWGMLKNEIEQRLFIQLGRHIPATATVELADFKGRKNWLLLIVSPEGKHLGDVWLGSNPDQKWAFDGLVRVGNAPNDYSAIVWQVFQRYSDGSYRRIEARVPNSRRTRQPRKRD